MKNLLKLPQYLLLVLIRLYQLTLSPFFRLLGVKCKFYPDCSHYGQEAIKIHGAIKGSWLTTKRFVKCGPFTNGGHDPVPPKIEQQKNRNKNKVKK